MAKITDKRKETTYTVELTDTECRDLMDDLQKLSAYAESFNTGTKAVYDLLGTRALPD